METLSNSSLTMEIQLLPNRITEKQGLGSAWNNRLTGNNIIRASFDFYTGPTVGSFSAYNYPQSTISGNSGVIVGIYFNPSSRNTQRIC